MKRKLTRKEAKKHAWRSKPYVYLQVVCCKCHAETLARIIIGTQLPNKDQPIPCFTCFSSLANHKIICAETIPTRFHEPIFEWSGRKLVPLTSSRKMWRQFE